MSGLSDDERDSLQEAVCDCGDPDCFVVTDVLWDALYASVERIVAARVQQARAEAWDECAEEAYALGWLCDSALADVLARTPYYADREAGRSWTEQQARNLFLDNLQATDPDERVQAKIEELRDRPAVVVDLSAYRRSNSPDGTTHLACPECGNTWWRVPGVVLEITDDDAGIHSVTGFAHPLTCIECEWTAPTPRPWNA